MKDYLGSENLNDTDEQEYLFQVLQGTLNILESTYIHDESMILKSFLSSVTIDDSKFSNIQYFSSSLSIFDSTFIFQNIEIAEIQTSTDQESFIVANSATLFMRNVSYSNSNSPMLLSLSSYLEIQRVSSIIFLKLPIYSLLNWPLGSIWTISLPQTQLLQEIEIIQVHSSENVTYGKY